MLKNWYAIYVNVRHEKRVAEKLCELNIEAYAPVAKKQQQWSDRKKWIEFPMLSGYVFVRIELEDKEKVLLNPSVFSFIKFGGVEAKIKKEDIETLKSVEKTGYDITTEVKGLKINDEVEILQGFLKGYKGVLVQFGNEDYVQIELLSLKQNVTVKVPKNILRIN
jgi:transcription antitermination factor NusG